MNEMMQVPDGWEVKPLKRIGTCKNGLTYSPNDIVESGGLLVLRSSNIQNSRIALEDNVFVRDDIKVNYKVQKNDILVCVRNGSKDLIGKNALITKEVENMAHGAFMTVFHSNINEYVFQIFQSDLFFKRVEKNLGATINSINNSDLLLFEFPFPKERKEQEKIAKILSTLDKAIESTNRLIEKEKNIKIALMQELLTNGIDQNGQIRSPKTYTYKQSELGFIPDEWEVKKIGEICKFKQGIQIPIEEQSFDYETGKYRFLRISDYTQQTEDKRYVSEIYKDYLITDTDVVMVRYGETAGFVGINLSGVLANNLFRIIPIKKIDNQFLYYYLNSLYDAFKDMREAGAMPAISFSSLSRVYFPLFNIEEQKQIAKILTAQDKEILTEEINLAKLKELKKGLMNDLLSGKVRVKI